MFFFFILASVNVIHWLIWRDLTIYHFFSLKKISPSAATVKVFRSSDFDLKIRNHRTWIFVPETNLFRFSQERKYYEKVPSALKRVPIGGQTGLHSLFVRKDLSLFETVYSLKHYFVWYQDQYIEMNDRQRITAFSSTLIEHVVFAHRLNPVLEIPCLYAIERHSLWNVS